MEPWIIRMCRETTRRQVIAWTVLLVVGIAILLANGRYATNFVLGPYKVGAKELAQISDPGAARHYFISITPEKVMDTGVQEITTTTRDGVKEGSRVTAGYYAAVVGDRFLIVKSEATPSSKIDGKLAAMPADLSNQLFSGPEGIKAQQHCYPFYLETEGFRYPGYWGIAVGVVFLALFFVFARRSWMRLRDINTHPVVRRLNQWGDPIGISFEAEKELTSGVRFRSQGTSITDKFVIFKTFFAFNLFRFQDLLWAYKKVTKKSVNFVPVGKDYAAILVFYGGSQTFTAKEKVVDEVLGFAAGKAPWAAFGFSQQLNNFFKKQTAEFCQAVEARRKQLAEKPAT